MADLDVEDFVKQNRHLAEVVDNHRSVSENEKQWKSRREFIFRNISDFEETHMDHLLALSMVWSNHIFMGCRYSPDLMEKVKEMAEGITVEDAPIFKTRDEIMKDRR
ncbi:CDKN2AIP N-terminal-like protein [Amia ocellicauda]|uniref:CDKN2AIP N-terminal-like protein n=1 Tax=Amia ocellicauda TaxID=2972642 RepID=UPI003464C604